MRWRLALVVCVLAATACGGGSGGGGGEGGGGGTPTPAGPDTPTFDFSPRYQGGHWSALVEETVLVGAGLLNYAQFTTDLVHRFAAGQNMAAATVNCAYSGTVTLQLTDRDGNGRASAGDSVTAVLDNCGVLALSRAATGTVRVDIQSSVSADVAIDFQARLVVVDSLRLAALAGGGNPGTLVFGVLRGSIGAQWSENNSGMVLRALSTTEDDLNFTATYNGIESVDRMRRIDVSQAVRYDLATSTGTLAFMYDVGTRGGAMRVRTPVSLQGDLDVVPKQMHVEIDLARGQSLRLQRATSPTGPSIAMTLATNGVADDTTTGVWGGGLLRFARDIRNPRGAVSYLDAGGGFLGISSWRETNLSTDVDSACRQGSTDAFFKADALFQRPVISPRALSEPDGVMRVQFGRAIAASTPALQFRFTDSQEAFDPRYPRWHVSATAERRGAYYEVRPSEPLRKGRTYWLSASTDGINWDAPLVFVDDQGGGVSSGGSSLATINTDITFVADLLFTDTGTVSASTPARLQSRANVLAGRTLVSARWQQISGAPVTLSTPDSVNTDVLLPAGPRDVADVVLQVTLTDNRGFTDRARVVVTVGDRITTGAAMYTDTGYTSLTRRNLTRGMGSVFYGPQAGAVHPRVPGPTEGGTGVNFSVVTVGGARLQPGMYANAAFTDVPGAQPGLISRVFCNTLGSPVSGWFEVLQVTYATDGQITQLALDYQQRCDTSGEYQKGSYRFNSALPLRP